MRFLLAAALMVCAAAPSVEAQSTNTKSDCNGRCKTNYGFCMSRAKTGKARGLCKTERKKCKGGCGQLKQ